MKRLSIIGMVLGLIILVLLVVSQGLGEIIRLLVHSGWVLLVLPFVWLPNLVFASESWRLLFRQEQKPTFNHALLAIWLGRSVNNLLPVATIGGEIVKARLLTLWGCKGVDASASVLVDKTVQVLAVIVWGLTGIALLFYLSLNDQLALVALGGFGVLAICVVGFFLVQRAGMFNLLSSLGAKLVKVGDWNEINNNAKAGDQTVMALYRNQSRFFLAVLLKTVSFVAQTGEVWLACYLLGFPIGILEALMLKSLTSTLSDVAFVIPSGYGIQEGAFMVIGALLGMGPEIALAVSLAIRIRELIIDLPGLLFWQLVESKRLLQRRIYNS